MGLKPYRTLDHIRTDEELRLYAEEVRAAALEDSAKVCEAQRDRILSKQSGREGDLVDTNLRMTAWLGADACAAAIRALATPS
jgi:hypothetical protein